MLTGLCSAEMADAAEGPEVAEFTDCGRAVEMPAIGSDFEGCHIPRAVLFREPQSPPFTAPFTPFVFGAADCVDMVDEVDVDEASEFSEEEELERCAGLRGMSILETSSALIVLRPFVAAPLGPLHPDLLLMDCRFGGFATAVICEGWQSQGNRSKWSVFRGFLSLSPDQTRHLALDVPRPQGKQAKQRQSRQ
jgi:hypothetical protein